MTAAGGATWLRRERGGARHRLDRTFPGRAEVYVDIRIRRGNRVRLSGRPRDRGRGVRSAGIATLVAVLLASLGCVFAQETASSSASRATVPRIEANRNVSPAGQL